MSEPVSAQVLDTLRALEADASELERIEDLLDRFNVFEVIGLGKQETISSNTKY